MHLSKGSYLPLQKCPLEQVAGKRGDPADDVYALGVIFWRLAAYTLQAPQFMRQSLVNSRLPTAAQQLIIDCLELPRGQRPANAGVFLQRLRQLPLTLAVDVGLEQLRQEADQARDKAQQAQSTQFAAQLQAQEQAAERLRQQQAKRLQPIQQPIAIKIKPDGSLVEQWQQIQHLTRELGRIKDTFAKERTQEHKHIDEELALALKKLGNFHSDPRDEEFEHINEYNARIAREQAQHNSRRQDITNLWARIKQENLDRINAIERSAVNGCQQALSELPATHYPFQYDELTGWRYNLGQQILSCQRIVKDLLPLEQLCLTSTATMPKEQAQLYRTNPTAFQIQGQFVLAATPPTIEVKEAYLEVAGEGRFPAQIVVKVEPDQEAIAFSKAEKIDTEAALEEFINNYPQSTQLPVAKQRLKELCTARISQELAHKRALARVPTNVELATYLGTTLALLLPGVLVLAICSELTLPAFYMFSNIAIFGAILGAIPAAIFAPFEETIGKTCIFFMSVIYMIIGLVAVAVAFGWFIFVVGLVFSSVFGLVFNPEPLGNYDVKELPLQTIALRFVYGQFFIGCLLIMLPFTCLLTRYKIHFFALLEQMVWVYALYAIITQYWFLWRFAGQFNSILLPTAYLMILTVAVTVLYLVRLVMRYRTLVNNRI